MLFKKVVFTIVGFSVFSGIASLSAMSSDPAGAMAMANEAMYGDRAGTIDMADAIASGSVQGVEFWLNKLCPFYERVAQGSCESECINSAIIAATRLGSVEIVKMLIKRKAVIEGEDYAGMPVMIQAIYSGNIETVRLLLGAKEDIEAQNRAGNTALLYAVRIGQVSSVKLLLEAKANIEAQNRMGNTALTIAITHGFAGIVKILLEAKACIETRDNNGDTALMQAVGVGSVDIVALLLKENADTEVRDFTGRTVLMMEVGLEGGQIEIVKLLLKAKANIESRDDNGMTPLIHAVGCCGNIDIVKLLLDAKANIEACDNNGMTPLTKAAWSGCEKIVELLLEAKVDIEAYDKWGETALIKAARKGQEQVIRVLLTGGASIIATDKEGNTALAWALKNKHSVVAKLLLGALQEQQRENVSELYAIERAVHRMKHIHKAMKPQASFAEGVVAQSAFVVRCDQASPKAMPGYSQGEPLIMETREEEEEKEGREVRNAQLTPTEVHLKQNRKEIESAFGKDVDKDPIVQQCIERERDAYRDDNVVFYRSEPGQLRTYEYFIEELYRLVQLYSKQHSFVFNRFFKEGAVEETIAQYVSRVGNRFDRGQEYNVLLSANIPLFGNVNLKSSCTWDYFKHNKSIEQINVEELFVSIFNRYGFDTAHIKDLLVLGKDMANSASLQQIIIPKEMVNDVAMLAQVGYCVPAQEKLSSVLERYMSEGSAIDDAWQVRLLMNRTHGLNPESGMQFYVYTCDVPNDALILLKNQVKKITNEIFGDWLIQQLDKKQLSNGCPPKDLENEPLETVLSYLGNEMFRQSIKQSQRNGFVEGEEEVKEREIEVQQVVGWQREQHHEPASVWHAYLSNKYLLDQGKLISSFMHDCARDTTQNAFIPQHYDNTSIARVMTYNVHKWTDPNDQDNYQAILQTIKSINPDVLVLQEVILSGDHDVEGDLKQMGYEYQVCMSMYEGWNFGNMIVSKYPFIQEPVKQVYAADRNAVEKRNFINTRIQLPNGKTISVYGTHLDVWDASGQKRMDEAQELVEVAQKDMTVAAQNGQDQNVLLVADWNAVRAKDYQYLVGTKKEFMGSRLSRAPHHEHSFAKALECRRIKKGDVAAIDMDDVVKTQEGDAATAQAGEYMTAWDVQTANFVRRVPSAAIAQKSGQVLESIPTAALEYIEKNGFRDSFTQTQASNESPRYTVWTGTVVDFIFCSPLWDLPVVGSYVYYSTASDHLPVIMDIELQSITWGFKPQPWLKKALRYYASCVS